MNNVVSYSLWGNAPMYLEGMKRNISLAETYYPGWETWIYHDSTVPQKWIDIYRNLGAKMISMVEQPGFTRLFWRFLPASIDGVGRFISQDADARIGVREEIIVEKWLMSGRDFLIIRDHPNHNWNIMGGMWGCKGGIIKEALIMAAKMLSAEKMTPAQQGLGFADDQRWLKSVVWPMAKKSALVFDDWKRFGGGLKLPQRGSKFDFVGNKYDENDKPMYSIETK